MSKKPNTILDFCEALGLMYSMDWDGEITLSIPERVNQKDFEELVRTKSNDIASLIKSRLKYEKMVYVGGPLAQQRHYNYWREAIAIHIERGKWAAYRSRSTETGGRDLRAFFCGFASNKAKAIALAGGSEVRRDS